MSEETCVSERSKRVIIILSAPVRAHTHMPPVFTVIGADDVFKVARQLGDGALGEC